MPQVTAMAMAVSPVGMPDPCYAIFIALGIAKAESASLQTGAIW